MSPHVRRVRVLPKPSEWGLDRSDTGLRQGYVQLMDADLLITILFSLCVVFGWVAWGLSFVRTVCNEGSKDAGASRRGVIQTRRGVHRR
jgi:hypothetical protein